MRLEKENACFNISSVFMEEENYIFYIYQALELGEKMGDYFILHLGQRLSIQIGTRAPREF